MKQKGKMDSSPISPSLSKKSASPKERSAGSSRPTLLLPLDKASERSQEPPVNKAVKSPPGFTPKNVSQPGSPILKKMVSALPGSPPQKNPEDKSPKLPLGPLQSPPKTHWSQLEEEGPLNLSESVWSWCCLQIGELALQVATAGSSWLSHYLVAWTPAGWPTQETHFTTFGFTWVTPVTHITTCVHYSIGTCTLCANKTNMMHLIWCKDFCSKRTTELWFD